MMYDAGVSLTPTRWTVNALPIEHPRWYDTRVEVEYYPISGDYLVSRMGYLLNHDGRWDLVPVDRGDSDWYAERAFSNLDGAVDAAKRAAAELAREVTR